MIAQRASFFRSMTTCVALALVVAGTPNRAHAAPEGDFEQRIAEADEHVGQGQHDEALGAYAEAFRSMPAELQATGVGEFVAVAAGKAALDDFAARNERRSLEQARDILRAFIAAAKRADPAGAPALIEVATQRLSEIDALLVPQAEPEAQTTAMPPPAPEGEGEAPAPVTEPDTAAPDRSRLGLALTVSGAVVLLAGVSLVIAGARQVPWYEQKLESEGWVTTDEGYEAQIADAQRIRNLDLGLGIGAAVIGAGLGVTGAVLMARGKKRQPRDVAVGPLLDRDRAGVSAVVRF